MVKNTIFLVLIVLLGLACEDAPENTVYQISVLSSLASQEGMTYEESLNSWSGMKRANGNSYIYQTTFISWTGDGHTTEIEVKHGVATARTYQEFTTDASNGQRKIVYSYREVGNDVGLNAKGAAPLTIDELYQTCQRDFITVDPERNTVHFETTNDGLMTLCGFVPHTCADDCYNGIRMSSFAWKG